MVNRYRSGRIAKGGVIKKMRIVKTHVPFSTKLPVVDVEIKNNIRDASGRFNYYRGEICIAGFFIDDEITQLVLKEPTLEEFRRGVHEYLGTINSEKLHAFNTNMEEGCFTKLLGCYPRMYEIKPPIKGRGTTKEYFFGFLVSRGIEKPESACFTDPLNGESERCPDCWGKGRHEDVRKHNLCCLTKEARILEHQNFILKELSHLIDSNGWLKLGATLPPVQGPTTTIQKN